MLPICFPVFGHVFDSITDVLKCTNGAFIFKGPSWLFRRIEVIFTCNPEDLRHITSSNFSKYPKGPDTKFLFEAYYGEFLFSTDHEEWRKHRELTRAFFNDQRMQQITPKANLKILEKGLIPVFDHASKQDLVLDLQDVLKRFMLDATSMIAIGYNHGSLQIGLPEDALLKALHDINQRIFMRHILPERLWKFQSWLGVGKEKKLQQAREIFDTIISEYLERKRKDLLIYNDNQEEFHAIKSAATLGLPNKIIRDIVKILLFGGTDTASSALTWFFLQVLENPIVESKIRKEIEEKLSPNEAETCLILTDPGELNKLVYLHAAILETMRLYPPAPFQSRTSIGPDIVPSGHNVSSMMKISLSCYAVGRMKSIWEENCLQFKPGRWTSEKERILPVPTHKFVAFGLGPRTCLGKTLSLIRLKAAAATIIYNYDIQVIKNHWTTLAESIFLEMKYGFKARIKKRSTT